MRDLRKVAKEACDGCRDHDGMLLSKRAWDHIEALLRREVAAALREAAGELVIACGLGAHTPPQEAHAKWLRARAEEVERA